MATEQRSEDLANLKIRLQEPEKATSTNRAERSSSTARPRTAPRPPQKASTSETPKKGTNTAQLRKAGTCTQSLVKNLRYDGRTRKYCEVWDHFATSQDQNRAEKEAAQWLEDRKRRQVGTRCRCQTEPRILCGPPPTQRLSTDVHGAQRSSATTRDVIYV